uniref:Putative acetyltransferase n=1 Tax=Aegilops tauschii TaxID=37682 RepID=M8C842_AEGTA
MGSIEHMEAAGTVRIVSRRMVRPSSGGGTPSEVIHLTPWDLRLLTIDHIQKGILLPKAPVGGKRLVDALASSLARALDRGGGTPSEVIHLTPWDLRLLTIDHIQKGILLPKAPVGGKRLVDALASSLARALDRYCHFAGRLAVEELGDGTVTVALRCTGDGAELVHAAAPSVAVTDLVGSVYTPSPVVWDLFSLNGVLDADAAIESLPVLSAQVTELADGVFVAVSMNHSVGDGTSFWEFFNAWSEIHRGDVNGNGLNKMNMVSTPSPVLARKHHVFGNLFAEDTDRRIGLS